MGRYLAIGIATNLSISKVEMKKGKIRKSEFLKQLEISLHFPVSIYDVTETDDDIILTLKNEIFTSELIPFLEKFYPILYMDKDESGEAVRAINKLRTSPPSDWMKIAEEKDLYYFQKDEYGENDRLLFDKDFQPRVKVCSDCIMFSAEGKIMMEVFGRQFSFFKYCMKEAFREFAIAGALRVYITG